MAQKYMHFQYFRFYLILVLVVRFFIDVQIPKMEVGDRNKQFFVPKPLYNAATCPQILPQ